MMAGPISVWWWAVQTTVIAGLGLAAAALLTKRRPAAAAAAATVAATIMIVLTFMLPLKLPRLAGQSFSATVAEASAARAEPAVQLSGGRAGIELTALLGGLFNALSAGARAEAALRPATNSWLVGLIGAGLALGLFRLAVAVHQVRRLARRQRRVCDEAVLRLFDEVKSQLQVAASVRLCESAALASPAVVGWRRPLVLLPANRTAWTEAQLKAALAHELAHVRRRDFLWRITAAASQAIHFLHPLAHVLTRRLALAQELAADRLAAQAVGSSREYVKALTELALRLDRERLRAEPAVLPAFSSNLMRRMVMLKSMEGFERRDRRSIAGAAAALAIVLAGIGSVAVRAATEDVPAKSATSVEPGLFKRQPNETRGYFRTDKGAFVVRVHELSERTAFVPVFQLLDRVISEELAALTNEEALKLLKIGPPAVRLERIDFIAGELRTKLKPKTGEAESERGQFTIGCEDFVVRFVDEVDGLEWLQDHLLPAKEHTDGDFKYVTLPVIPAIAPNSLSIAQSDSHTLVCSASVERLRKMVRREMDASKGAAETITPVDGGLAALAADLTIEGGLAEAYQKESAANEAAGQQIDQPLNAVIGAIAMNVKQVATGFDLETVTSQSGIRVNLVCENEKAAEEVRQALKIVRPLADAYLAGFVGRPAYAAYGGTGEEKNKVQTAGTATTEAEGVQFWLDTLRNCSIETKPLSDGRCEVRLESHAKFPGTIYTSWEERRGDEDGSITK
jgi:beta-lactamase regulating signal transducer with metallopeptidase domain